jgi:engulfment and cell motility protein 1
MQLVHNLRIKVALQNELRPLHELVALFLECEYRDVRDRQLKELELEDDLLNKIPVRYGYY